MSMPDDIERFIRDPSLLVKLCRDVIDRLDAVSEDTEVSEQRTQLREISRSIERLEKAGVSVPVALRGEKLRLAADLGIKADATQALTQLVGEFAEIVHELKIRLNLDGREKPTLKKLAKGKKRSLAPKTPAITLRHEIIRALKKLGGRASVSDVVAQIGNQLDGKLVAGDLTWREATNEYAWQNNVKWERYRMIQEGILRNDSPRGIWDLNKDQS